VGDKDANFTRFEHLGLFEVQLKRGWNVIVAEGRLGN
jgi:hypothetical protein